MPGRAVVTFTYPSQMSDAASDVSSPGGLAAPVAGVPGAFQPSVVSFAPVAPVVPGLTQEQWDKIAENRAEALRRKDGGA